MEPVFEPLGYASARDREQLMRDIEAALAVQNMPRAAKLARAGLQAGIEHPGLLTLVAHESQAEGRTEEALGYLARARALAPKEINVLNATGFCLAALGRDDEALEAYEAALKVDPGFAPAVAAKAELDERAGRIDAAVAGYEKAVRLGLNEADPMARRAWLAAEQGDVATARSWAERALALDPAQPIGRMALARSLFLDGRYGEAKDAIETSKVASWGPANRAHALGILADAFDAEGDTDEAYECYAGANREMARLYGEEFALRREHNPAEFLTRLTVYFDRAKAEDWQAQPVTQAADGPAQHVFLVGYPRSGTTLLEQILAARPDAVTLEEKPSLSDIEDAFFVPSDGIDRLAALSAEETARFRELYWRRVRSFGVEPKGKLFVDKMPLNTVLLPAIAKIFPDAKILLALRDPRDVVLSCFRQRFGASAAMFVFLTLEGTAYHYGAVMKLAETYRQALPLDLVEVRHERVASDLEGEMKAVCAFLGVDWDPAMADFAARRGRAINTPSAAQLAKGLNTEGVGQWRRYRNKLAPVLPSLAPWVERFGYEPTGEA